MERSLYSAIQPALLTDLYLLQGYVLSPQGQCLLDLAPSPDLPQLAHCHLAEHFAPCSVAQLQHQLERCMALSSQHPIEEYLYLFDCRHKQRMAVFSCMTPVHIMRSQAECVLWRPIVIQHYPPWDVCTTTSFHQWLSLSVDHLWRLQRPFSLLMFDIEANDAPPTCSVSQLITLLMRLLPTSAITTQVAHRRFVALLPFVLSPECHAIRQEVIHAFDYFTKGSHALRLASACHTYRVWPRHNPPSIQPVNHLLLQRLVDALQVAPPAKEQNSMLD